MNALKLLLFMVAATLFGCNRQPKNVAYANVPGYDFNNPLIIKLNPSLDEISGISYYAKDNSIFAINDQLGVLYKIYIRPRIQVQQWKFAGDGDYEDVAVVNNTFYALESSGRVMCFRYFSKDSFEINEVEVPIEKRGEFETLYYDKAAEKLGVICKDCKGDKKGETSVFFMNPEDQAFFSVGSIKNTLSKKPSKFKPSGAALHTITHELYILSAESKELAIADTSGNVKKVFKLNPKLFKQPEGITFTPKGDMLISNESAEIGAPNILIFTYNPAAHEQG